MNPQLAETSMALRDALLVVEFQGNVIRTLPLTSEMLTVGRAPDNDLSLQHPAVSRHHLELSANLEGMVVTDRGSVNGTYVDDVRVLPDRPTPLKPGGAIRVGPFVLAARRLPIGPDGRS